MIVVYCPRCDKPIQGATHAIAMATMRVHLMKHPDATQEMLDSTII